MPNDTINEDDFDYFQYFGQKRADAEQNWVENQKEDIAKFKSNRANLVLKEEDKNSGIYIAKDTKIASPKAKLKVILYEKNEIILSHSQN